MDSAGKRAPSNSYGLLARRIRVAHAQNPDADPMKLARRLNTSPKYVSKVLRAAGAPKFRTGRKTK